MLVDFECPKCGVLLEKDIPFGSHISQAPRCLECGEDMLRKFSVRGVNFKGSGFYKTDKNKNS